MEQATDTQTTQGQIHLQVSPGLTVTPPAAEASADPPASTWMREALTPVMEYALTFDGRTIEFDFERPHTYADFERLGQSGALAFGDGESRLDGMRGALSAFVLDCRGLPDFEPRAADEDLVLFRSRFGTYWSKSSEALVALFLTFNSEVAPLVVRRKKAFRP